MSSPGGISWQKGVLFFIFSVLFCSCKSFDEQKKKLPDTRDRGSITISADESFKPVIDALVQVYESHYPGTHIRVVYKPESECLKDFLTDSIRMIIATRGLSREEEDFVADSFRMAPEQMIVALDAITVVVNPLSRDSFFTVNELKQILTGNFKKNLMPVFDGLKATGTVRYIIDSVLRGGDLSPQASAARSSEGVLDYVAENPDAIGFIGVSWIGNKEDTAQTSFLKKVKIARLESMDSAGKFILPIQANLYRRNYPMTRGIYYILKEKHKGLGHGFGDFMSGETGQLIFKRAYLAPAQRDFIIRPARLRD